MNNAKDAKNERNLDRLIHMLLDEELGGKHPPDLTEVILERSRSIRRRRVLRWGLRLGVAATIALAFICVACWSMLNRDYPKMRLNNVGLLSGTDNVYSAQGQSGTLDLGDYCHIALTKGSSVKVEGEPCMEQIYLIEGEVHCIVDRRKPRKDATFSVRTDVGVVRVTGTEFVVRILEKEEGAKMRQMMVKVITGAVIVSGAWGNLAMSADGVKEKILPEKKEVRKESISPAMQKVLKKKHTVEFVESKLEDVLDYLRRIAGDSTSIVYKNSGSREVPAVTLSVRKMSFENILKWVITIAGLRYEIRKDTIYIYDRQKATKKSNPSAKQDTKREPDNPLNAQTRKLLKSKRITVSFRNTPLSDVMRNLSVLSEVNIVLNNKVDADKPIILKVSNMSLEKSLDSIMLRNELRYEITNGAVCIHNKTSRETDGNGQNSKDRLKAIGAPEKNKRKKIDAGTEVF